MVLSFSLVPQYSIQMQKHYHNVTIILIGQKNYIGYSLEGMLVYGLNAVEKNVKNGDTLKIIMIQ